MKAIDFRNATFEGLRATLDAKRQSVYAAFVVYGPGTTRRVAGEAGISLLTFRPRTTELLQLGLVGIVGDESRGKEGVYQVTRPEEWEDWRSGMVSGQQALI